MNTQNVFEVQEVSFAYNGVHTALDGVSMQIAAEESVVIVGANGCGKSTLLKLLDGLCYPHAGSVTAFGSPLTEEALRNDEYNFAFRRRVGLVFQDSDVQLFSPSVQDELAFAPLQLGLPPGDVEQRIDAALSILQIAKLRHRAPHNLSGGEKRRVALASLLTLQPDVWLMDEPSAGLDPRSHSWLIEFIREQHRLGNTMVIATHDLSLAEEIATSVYVFDEDHHIVSSGEPREVLGDHELLHRCNLYHYHSRAEHHDTR